MNGGIPPPCTKCRFGSAEEGDSWCLGCRALESAQATLKVRWWSNGHRRVAEEVLFDATRQLRALKQLDQSAQSLNDSLQAKLKRAQASQPQRPENRASGSRPEVKSEPVPEPSEPPRAHRVPLKASGPPPAEEESSSEGYGEEEEEEPKTPRIYEHPTTAAKAVPPRPPSPPPRSKSTRAERPEWIEDPAERRETKRRKGNRPGHRGGVKHQRKYRDFDQSTRVSHQKLKAEDFDRRARQREVPDQEL